MKVKSLIIFGMLLIFALNAEAAFAVSIWGPMVDNFDINVDADEWFGVADSSGTVSATIYSGDEPFTATLIGSTGSNVMVVAGGSEGTVSLSGLTPGEEIKLEILGGFHYRPMFEGVDSVFINQDAASPNDWLGDTSDIELGFDQRWTGLPSEFADITWYYDLQAEASFDWEIRSGWPGGSGIADVELLDPLGISQGSLGPLDPYFAPIGFNILNPMDGLWAVHITSPEVIESYAQHYSINASPNRLVLLEDSIRSPFASVPEPASLLLLSSGLAVIVSFRRKFRA